MNALAIALAKSPELFPHALDLRSDMVSILRLTRADYESASFLDGRIAIPARPTRLLPWSLLAQAVGESNLHESCHFLFHIGHVGSTLLSRLLGKHPALFSLREPEILRTLARATREPDNEPQLAVFLKLWSRTFDPHARVLLKASSFVSGHAGKLLARPYAPKAIAMGVAPESYLATIFGGANSPGEAAALAPFRLARLNRCLGCDWKPDDLSTGEVVAAGWACETLALAEAARQAGAQVQTLNFDRFLAQPDACLALAFEHLGVRAGSDEISAILAGPEMKSYSKAPEFSYDLATRRAELDEGRSRHASEIRHGLRWLDRVAREFPQLESALALFG